MPRIPGSFNGGIPPNIEWDEDNPPTKFACSNGPLHLPQCNGTCESALMKEHEVEMFNELLEWNRAGMNPQMITTTSTPFDFEVRISAITDFLVEKGILDVDELNEFYTRMRINRMQELRLANQEAVKRTRLGLPAKPQIFGPGGEAL